MHRRLEDRDPLRKSRDRLHEEADVRVLELPPRSRKIFLERVSSHTREIRWSINQPPRLRKCPMPQIMAVSRIHLSVMLNR